MLRATVCIIFGVVVPVAPRLGALGSSQQAEFSIRTLVRSAPGKGLLQEAEGRSWKGGGEADEAAPAASANPRGPLQASSDKHDLGSMAL